MLTRLLFACLALLLLGTAATADDRPNFILFIADDISDNDLGCYGNPAARTPSIDKLASHGLRFNHFYLTASSCSVSRCSIVTGRYPHNNGAASELHRPLPAHLVKFPQWLKAAGYYTALAGKDHMPQDKANEAAVWDAKEGTRVPGNSGGEGHWVDLVKNRPQDKPFFFWFAAIDAHRGWEADREWQAEKYGPKHKPEEVVVPPYLVDSPKTRDDLASYYNEITRFDYYIGQVVEELKKQNALDNTVLMVMADNGRPFPRAKTRLHDSGMKSPLVIHWPKGIADDRHTTDSLTSAVDLCPTILSLAGLDIPEQVQGYSFAEVLKAPQEKHRDYAFSEHNWHDYEAHGRGVRTDEGYLYIRNARPEKAWLGPADSIGSPSHAELVQAYVDKKLTTEQADVFTEPRPAEELYFTPEDPNQVNNLVGKERHAQKLAELRGVMDRWQKETGDSAPANITPDFFSRETGQMLPEYRKQKMPERPWGDPAGSDREATKINQPGPR